MSAHLYFTTDFSFFRQLPVEHAEPYPVTWSEVSVIWKCMSKIWSIPLQTGGPKTAFLRILQLKDNFNSPYLWNETWYT